MNHLEKYFTPFAIELMQQNNIDLRKLGSRLYNGQSLDKSFASINRGRKTIYPEWAFKQAKENGISRQLLHHRVKIQGLPVEEAIRPKAT